MGRDVDRCWLLERDGGTGRLDLGQRCDAVLECLRL